MMTRFQLRKILAGANWKDTGANAFGGQGSMGNGSAMRVAPLGAYFADDLERCVLEARASSLVTHAHPEGVAGAIAVAIAASVTWTSRSLSGPLRATKMFENVLRCTPEGRVRDGLLQASQTSPDTPIHDVANALGNGSRVTAPDTVPFCIWMAARYAGNFVEALAQTIRVGGDCDTNAAIVGGIVALSAGRENIPAEWLAAREEIVV